MPKTQSKIAFLEKVSAETPEYREVLSVFEQIYRNIDGREGETGVTFEPSREHDAVKAEGGLPLLSREDIRVDREQAARFITTLIDVALRVGREGGESLTAMKQAVADGRYDLEALLAGCLTRERAPVEEAAQATGVPSPLLEFILCALLKTALEHFNGQAAPPSVEKWKEAYCPVCGGRAGMAELTGEEGKRRLCCSACFFTWQFARIKCPYCGNDDPDSLSYFQVGEEPTRVDVCKKCSRYIKTRDSRKGNADVPLEAEDLVTLHLDLLAVREGFERGK